MQPVTEALAAAALLWLALLSAWLYLLARPSLRAGSRHPRRGGYMELSPRASGFGNRTMALTPTPTATSTECKMDGLRQAGAGGPVTLRALSRTTAPIDSSGGTGIHRGDLTTDAATRD